MAARHPVDAAHYASVREWRFDSRLLPVVGEPVENRASDDAGSPTPKNGFPSCASGSRELAFEAGDRRERLAMAYQGGKTDSTDAHDDESNAVSEIAERVVPALRELAAPLANGAAVEVVSDPAEPDALARVIESDLIPRLMLAHARMDEPRGPEPAEDLGVAIQQGGLSPEEHERFLILALNGGEQQLLDEVREFLSRGISRVEVLIALIGGAARRLGDLWESDEITFTDVTIGLCRLHMVLREESGIFDPRPGRVPSERERSILLVPIGGDQHILGLILAAEFFRREGWRVVCEPGLDNDGVADLLANDDFDMLGISLCNTGRLKSLASQVEFFRKASRNPELGVMVGGWVVDAKNLIDPGDLGVDVICRTAAEGPELAEAFVSRLSASAGLSN